MYTEERTNIGPFFLLINWPATHEKTILEFSVVLGHLCAAIDRGLLFQQMHILLNLSLPQGLI